MKEQLTKHAFAVAIAVCVVFAGRVWLQEHDARLTADQTVKAAQVQIDGLQKQKDTVEATASAAIAALKKQAAAVRTPAQAIPEIPKVAARDLQPEALPNAPDKVAVQAVPLYQELNECKQDTADLAACSAKLDIQEKITAEKDTQITALKQKPGFFHRLGRAVKTTACAGIGGGLGSVKGGKGAAIGAAGGAAICQLF